MKEPKLNKRPDYKLLKQSDTVSFFHMQMPRWLFFDPKYTHLSLEAKVAYTFLLNRFQLSKMNGWINSEGEVFVIFPREKLAVKMGVSYRKAISCMGELLSAGLIWEHRIGRGSANHIYMAAVEFSNESASNHESAPFVPRSAESAGLDDGPVIDEPTTEQDGNAGESDVREIGAQNQEVPYLQNKKCHNGTSATAKSAHSDLPFSHANKIEDIKKDKRFIETVSQSCHARTCAYGRDIPADNESEENLLKNILDNCELGVLPEDEAGVFRNAITRLFYSESIRTGNAVLPKHVIRSSLHNLDASILLDAREKLRLNLNKKVKNSTAYVMATLFNNICEYKSDLMVDPYLNSMGMC